MKLLTSLLLIAILVGGFLSKSALSAPSEVEAISESTRTKIRSWMGEMAECMAPLLNTYRQDFRSDSNPEKALLLVMKLQLSAYLREGHIAHWAKMGGFIMGCNGPDLEPKVIAPCVNADKENGLKSILSSVDENEEKAMLTKGLEEWDMFYHRPPSALAYDLQKLITDAVSPWLPSLAPEDGIWKAYVQPSVTHSQEWISASTQDDPELLGRRYILHRYSDAGFLDELNKEPQTGKWIEIGAQGLPILTHGKVLYVDIDELHLEMSRKAARALELQAEFQIMDMERCPLPPSCAEKVVSKNVPLFLESSLKVLQPGGRRFFLNQGRDVLPVEGLLYYYKNAIKEAESYGLVPEFVVTEHLYGLILTKP